MTRNIYSLAVPESNWHRRAVGGRWDEIGELQFDFLVEQGLQASDYLLDVGCGSLRGGVRFIRYLDTGHYYGVDKNQALLDAGKDIELSNQGLITKQPWLVQMDDFNFASLDQQFDMAIAQSVFTHLYLNHIVHCLMNMAQVLRLGGRFFATFFENPKGKFNLEPIYHPGLDEYSFFDKDPFHYDVQTFEYVCQDTNLEVTYIGDWGHPRNQKMMVFTKRG